MEKLPDLIIQVAGFSSMKNNLKTKRIVELRFTPSDYLIQLNVKIFKIKKIIEFNRRSAY